VSQKLKQIKRSVTDDEKANVGTKELVESLSMLTVMVDRLGANSMNPSGTPGCVEMVAIQLIELNKKMSSIDNSLIQLVESVVNGGKA
jgi:hypothetical protein